jgi:hypothetical protein
MALLAPKRRRCPTPIASSPASISRETEHRLRTAEIARTSGPPQTHTRTCDGGRFGETITAMRGARLGSLALLLCVAGSCLWGGCAKQTATAEVEAPIVDRGPGIDEVVYVSGNDDDVRAPAGNVLDDDEPMTQIDGEFVVRSPSRALEIAEAAVVDELDPKHTWKTSPVLPARWPSKDHKVLYLFYPMAANPNSLSHYHLFSPAYEVEVSLVDGTTEVRSISKRRRLGVIEDRRPSLSERHELELAENTLVRLLVAGQASQGDNNFWGYLKYFHENPAFAKHIKGRSPAFVKWLNEKKR